MSLIGLCPVQRRQYAQVDQQHRDQRDPYPIRGYGADTPQDEEREGDRVQEERDFPSVLQPSSPLGIGRCGRRIIRM